MTIQYVIDEALSLADEVGNEAEYKEKIIRAINHVQAKISKFAKPIKKYINLETNNKIITFPKDFLSLVNVKNQNDEHVLYTEYDRNKIKVNGDGTYRVCYNAILSDFIIEDDLDLEEEIMIEDIANQCLIYGVAAEICMDNEELYPILQNEYNNLLANLELAINIPTSGSVISHIEGMWY